MLNIHDGYIYADPVDTNFFLRGIVWLGISFDQALVWVDCIKEVAQKERIDERTAAWKLADMLWSFKDLCGLDKAIQQATQQLFRGNFAPDVCHKILFTISFNTRVLCTVCHPHIY